MITPEEIKNLASLARLEVSEAESAKLQHDLGAILDYVGELKLAPRSSESEAGNASEKTPGENYNKLREDGAAEASLSEEEREKLLGGKFLKVKKIL